MSDVSALIGIRRRMLAGTVRALPRGGMLKIATIITSSLLFIGGLFFGFWDGFTFIHDQVPDLFEAVASYLFSMFYFALSLMLAISCGIIFFSGAYRGREVKVLFSHPIDPEGLFAYKFGEALFWSSWAFAFLSLPLVAAFGIVAKTGAAYYVGALVFLGPFVLLCAAVGALGAVLVARFLLAHRKRVIVLAVAGVVLFGASELWRLFVLSKRYDMFSQPWIVSILEGTRSAKAAVVPSAWMTRGTLSLAGGRLDDAAYFFLVLLSNALFVAMVAIRVGGMTFQRCYDHAQGISSKRRYVAPKRGRPWMRVLFWYLTPGERELILKDIRTFRRDVAQWSQFLIFFGLLGIYFVNIRRMGYDEYGVFWRNLVSFLNIAATSMTMATFTSRFIFPQVSLEGKRFWVLGLAPLSRAAILRSKFAFSATACVLLSVGLIAISDAMLRVDAFIVVLHLATMIGISMGLSGLAVGLGARFPSLREDNPSKIVAGFGGTLNLVISAFYVAFIVAVQAVPCHLYYAAKTLSIGAFRTWIIAGIIISTVTACLATLIPYTLGARAFAKMEM